MSAPAGEAPRGDALAVWMLAVGPTLALLVSAGAGRCWFLSRIRSGYRRR